MSDKDERVRSLIAREAADWFVANRAGLAAAERDSFAAWLKSSPMHVEEYLGVAAMTRDLRDACADSAGSVDALVARARTDEEADVRPLWARVFSAVSDRAAGRWQTAAVSMAALAVVSVSLFLLWSLRPISNVSAPADVTALHFETRHGEQQTHRLADDSVLHLNTDSALTIRYTRTQRLVTLTSGEAEFEVTHEHERLFRVFAGSAEVVDLGTRFDVRLEHDSTVVTVVAGRVGVRPSRSSSPNNAALQFVQVAADQQLSVTSGAWPATPLATDAQRATAWLHRQISFEREPLERVAAEFNRYTSKPIVIASPALRSLQISGVFAIGDPDAFIAFLRSLEGVRVEVTATRVLVSKE